MDSLHKYFRVRNYLSSLAILSLLLFSTSALAEGGFLSNIFKKSEKPAPATPEQTSPIPKIQGYLEKIRVPESFGSIKEIYNAYDHPQSALPKNQVIVHIQDAHVNYEAQKNIANIIELLVKEHQLKLVLVEGGIGNVSLSYLRAYADKERRQKVADEYLKEGKISGEEYLDIAEDYELHLEGIEKLEYYQENMDAFLTIETFKDKALDYLNRMDYVVKVLKEKIYGSKLKEFEGLKSQFDKGDIQLAAYCRRLDEMAKAHKVDLSGYSQFQTVLRLDTEEKQINFKTAEEERKTLINEITKQLEREKAQELVSRSLDFKQEKIRSHEFHTYLSGLATSLGIGIERYPNLKAFIGYEALHEQLDALDVFTEKDDVEKKIREVFFRNDDEKRLALTADKIEFLKDFVNLKLPPHQFKRYEADRGSFKTQGDLEWLQKIAQKNRISQGVPDTAYLIDQNLSKLETFYTAAAKRDLVFLLKTEKLLAHYGEKLAVLKTGGFHTERMTHLLREKGYSYIVVVPKVTQPTNTALYHKILKYKNEHFDSSTIKDTVD